MTGYGRFLLLLYVAFGLPHLVIRPVLAAASPFGRAAASGMAVGLSIAAGFSLLFTVLMRGSGEFWFISENLLFGAVAGLATVTVFRLLARPEPDAHLAPATEPSIVKRVAISVAALAISCGTLCLLFLAGAMIFDRYDSAARWLPLDVFFVVFSLTGWFLFGLPILVAGPLRQRFTRPFASALAGGAAGVVLIEAFYRTQFTGRTGGSVWQAVLVDAAFSLGAFLVGALTTYLYVQYRGRSSA